MPTADISSAFLTRTEAAKLLRIKPGTLATWASSGRNRLPFYKVGRSVKYLRSDIDNWLASRRQGGGTALEHGKR